MGFERALGAAVEPLEHRKHFNAAWHHDFNDDGRINSIDFSTYAAKHKTVPARSLMVDYTGSPPLESIANQLVAGYSGGAWTGSAIASAGATTSTGHQTALGYAEASATGGAFVNGDSINVRYT